ncbi:MAG: gamma-glutamyltransferase family protein [Planctomycetota bacterium]|jgi:gamma-glutamyltranspeptidase/glutathione hydrolase
MAEEAATHQVAFHPQRVAASRTGMIATQHWDATQAGVSALEQGGNAIDAAVAAAFALNVCEPGASGLGGQTMMLVHIGDERRTFALDGSSRAPHRVLPDSLSTAELRRGHRATTVPSTPAVLAYALKTHGKLPLAQVLSPSIRLAEKGYVVSALQERLFRRELKHLRAGSASAFFLKEQKRPYREGEVFRQPVLARTLKRLRDAGWEDFYTGRIAKAIHDDMRRNDGLVHLDDLAQIPLPIERRPVSGRFEGMRVFTFPPPGAGRTLLEILNLLSQFPESKRQPDTPQGALLLAEIIRRANLDRRDRPFDPNFYPQVDERRMLSEEYAKRAARQVRSRIRPPVTHGETTHLSAMDAEGNAVALTQSIERVFGSFEASPKLGFLYNNYMSAFEYGDITHPYYLRPAAAPWASVAPTIVMRGRKPYLAAGSPGSERIASSVAQVLIRLKSQSLIDAVTAPRMHCNINGEVPPPQPWLHGPGAGAVCLPPGLCAGGDAEG